MAPPRSATFPAKLSEWKEDPEFLGPGWHGPTGLVIDDLADLSSLLGPEREVASKLAAALPAAGVVACADFSYTRRDRPAIITLRVLVFKDLDAVTEWWKEKYEAESAKASYAAVTGVGDQALDYKDDFTVRRIVRSGRVVLTCHQLDQTRDHIKVLERYLAKLSRP